MTDKFIQIAVITNNPERAEVIDTTSRRLGWQVDANSGHLQPLRWLLNQAVEIALIDIEIPNAVQLIADISKYMPDLPLLALVEQERLVDLQPAILAGAQDFVALPLNSDHYKAVIERALRVGERELPDEQSVEVSSTYEAFEEEGMTLEDTRAEAEIEATPESSVLFDDMLEQNEANTHESMVEPEVFITHESFSTEERYLHPSVGAAVEPVESVNTIPLAASMPSEQDLLIEERAAAAVPPLGNTVPPLGNTVPNDYLESLTGNGSNGHRLPKSVVNAALSNGSVHSDGASSSTALVKVGDYMNGNGHRPIPSAMPPSSNSSFQTNKRIVAVVGLRGGVGRSTIAANLALAVEKPSSGSVALVEAHHNLSHLSLMLHLHPRNTIAGLAEAKSLDLDIVQGHLQSHGSGINVLAAPSHLDDLVELSGDQWATTLGMISELSPIMIIDTGSTVDSALLETLVLATDIIVVMNPEIASLRATTAMVNSLYTESEVQGKVHVVLNRSGVGGGLDEGTIRKQLGHELAATLPDDPGLATYAMNRGVPFVHSHARSLLTKRMKALANKVVLGESVKEDTKRTARSFLPFLGTFG